MAIADNPSVAAALIKLSGSDAPSRKLYEEWQCNSAQGITSSASSGSMRRLARLVPPVVVPSALLPPVVLPPVVLPPALLPLAALPLASFSPSALSPPPSSAFPQDRRRSNSRHDTGGLFQPICQS